MTILSPSGMETANYRAAGAVAIVNSNTQKLNTYLGKMMTAADAEVTVESANNDTTPVFHVKNSDGTKLFEILANGTTYPKFYPQIIYATSQAEIDFTSLDSLRNKLFLGPYRPRVIYSAGTFTSLDLSNIISDFEIVGETRSHAGLCYPFYSLASTVIPHWSTKSNVGVGRIALSNSGNYITVDCDVTDPDFTGWGAGDKLIICDTSKNLTVAEIVSVSGNAIELTTTAPTVNGYGAAIVFVPNRILDLDLAITNLDYKIKFTGFKFESDYSSQIGLYVNGKCKFENCLITSTSSDTFSSYYNADIEFVGHENTIIGGTGAALVANGGNYSGAITGLKGAYFVGLFMGNGKRDIDYSRFIAGGGMGLHAECSYLNAQYACAIKNATRGFSADAVGGIYCRGSIGAYNQYGWYTANGSGMQAYDYYASGNTTNFNGSNIVR